MKTIWKIAEGVLALIGGLTVFVHGITWVFFNTWSLPQSMPTDASVAASYPSPDGQNKAVIFSQAGGGGLSPYCFDFISVVPTRVTDVNAWSEQNRIFSASCNGVSVTWTSARNLQIRFDPTEGANGIAAMVLKGYAEGGSIKISYVQK